MSDEWRTEIGRISEDVLALTKFHVSFWTEAEFNNFIDNMKHHIETYLHIWFMGYFDNSFVKKIEKYYTGPHVERIDMRVLSLPFKKDTLGKKNKTVLEKLSRIGVEVKLREHLHGRMMLLLPEMGVRSEVVIGSFDFTKESFSGEKTNVGIHTTHPDIVASAKALFDQIWKSDDTVTLIDYIDTNW